MLLALTLRGSRVCPWTIHTTSLKVCNFRFTVKHPRVASHPGHTCPDVWPGYSLQTAVAAVQMLYFTKGSNLHAKARTPRTKLFP